MTNEENESSILVKAVEEALKVPVPSQETPDLMTFQKCAPDRVGLPKNKFRVGSKEVKVMAAKSDSEGKPVVHGNGGHIYLKDYSNIKFWHEGKRISKAEHDELTNGVK